MERNNILNQTEFIKDVKELINYLWDIEQDHYIENDKPKDHIFKTIKRLSEHINKNGV